MDFDHEADRARADSSIFAVLLPALDRLPEIMRILLLLRCYDRMSSFEIAAMLGCELQVVRSLLNSAFHLLEKQLSAEQIALEKRLLRKYIRKAYEIKIEEQEPDPDSVARIRVWINQLAAS